MKKLSIEQKAKAYDEAIERAKDFYKGYKQRDNQLYADDLESIFPELKESEDENVRKSIIAIINNYVDNSNTFKPKMIAWLEKQCESKPACKIQVSDELYEHIRNTCACINDALSSKSFADINDYLSMAEHSAQSAFDMIEKQGEQKPAEWSEDNLPEFESYLCLMFQKFRTKGICTNGEIIDYVNEHSQKLKDILCHAWSEEDNKNLEKTVWYVEKGGKLIFQKTDKLMSWLKSLKDRYTWKPTMEQLTVLSNAIELRPLYESDGIILMSLYYDLKKLTE